MFVSLTRVCVVYVVKEVTSFPGARSINLFFRVGNKREWHVIERALELYKATERKRLVGLLAKSSLCRNWN